MKLCTKGCTLTRRPLNSGIVMFFDADQTVHTCVQTHLFGMIPKSANCALE